MMTTGDQPPSELLVGRTRAPRQSSTDCRGNLHNVISDPSAVNAKGRHPIRDDLTDQPRLVFIGRPFAAPFLFIPFNHESELVDA